MYNVICNMYNIPLFYIMFIDKTVGREGKV